MIDLEPLTEALASQPAVQLAVLYGSLARGQGGPRSDVDIGLRLEPSTLEDRRRVELALMRAVNRRTDFVYLDEAPPLLRFQIARDGRVLLERQPRLWTHFKARAMVDWWDWAPTARKIHAVYVQRLREGVHGRP